MSKIIETDRLILRTWNDDDLQPMLAINQDPKVMEYFPELQDLETTKKRPLHKGLVDISFNMLK